MTDEPKTTEQPEGGKPQEQNGKITLQSHGRTIDLDHEQVQRYADIAMEYENRVAELDKKAAKLDKDSDGYQEYLEFKRTLQADPKRAKAIARAFEDPDVVLSPRPSNGADDLDDEDEPRHGGGLDPEVKREIQALRQEVSTLRASDQQRRVNDRRSELEKRVDASLAGHSWLKTNEKMLELAKQQVVARLAATPDKGVEAVTTLVAQDLKDAWEATKQAELDASRHRQDLSTVSPRGGVPQITPDKKGSMKDLQSGNIAKSAIEAIRKLTGQT